ncbi:ferritin-like domain-containing protein [Haloferula chungangensis]|uniref:Ferritin-like domain-containing protein n=1 Tax=Haloferula chungangensis TaxID=1048331 RepID=A0ABW2L0Y8_9BACT
MLKLTDLKKLLEHDIKDLYSAETQLVKALPKMAKAANAPELKEAFESHLEETRDHVERLSQAAEILGCRPGGQSCKAMKGLIEEGEETIEEEGDATILDLALITAAQKVEHYEISGYGSARKLAETLKLSEVVKLLDETIEQEGAADKKLTTIAKSLLKSAPKPQN